MELSVECRRFTFGAIGELFSLSMTAVLPAAGGTAAGLAELADILATRVTVAGDKVKLGEAREADGTNAAAELPAAFCAWLVDRLLGP